MSLVSAGDIGAMGLLYEKYKKPLYAYFYKVTRGDDHSSEDLVHTVFYRAIRYRSTFTGKGSFVKWLFTIAHNVCIDFRKRDRKIIEYKADTMHYDSFDDEHDNTQRNERLEMLEAALGRLTEEERELVILCKIECLLYNDVADILGISEGNVRIRMFRAIRKLRDILLKLENSRYEKTGS